MSDAISDFLKRAGLVTVSTAVGRLEIKLPRKVDAGMPCPRCGGKDRFAVNPGKGAWNCRSCGGGKTGLGLIGHVLHLDLHRRADLLEAAAIALGEPVPAGGERESDADRAAREARMREALARAEQDAAGEEEQRNWRREQEIRKARGIYLNATVAPHPDDGQLREYLRLRTGRPVPDAVFENIRFSRRRTYWHGLDERGNPLSHYVGYAMIAPFVDLCGHVTGSHETWIDLDRPPKFRPDLGLDSKGEPLTTKKMRGAKKGSIIPVCGDLAARRWVGAEGIETVAAFAGIDGWRADTLYFATGDLGNLAGPADSKSAFGHPTLRVMDVRGVSKPVRVQGPSPKPGQRPNEAYQLPGHVDDLIHLADGDSEPVATAAAMARAEARLVRDGLGIHTQWPPAGTDFAALLAEAGET